MSRLPDPDRSYAVLIGASTYQSPKLPDLPSVRNNLDGVLAALTDERWGGFRRDRCSVIGDSADARSAYLLLREQAARADDTFVVYFAGHGLTGPVHHDLYLAVGDTEMDALGLTALSFALIREVFLDCPAVNRVLILDCCYSGRAARGFMGEPTLGQVEIAGTYTLTSVPPNALSHAPVGANYTAFTAELLDLLEQGIPDGPELLSLHTLYAHLARRLTSKGYLTPGRQGTNSADQLALTRNPAHHRTAPAVAEQTTTTPVPPSVPVSPPSAIWPFSQTAKVLAVILAMAVSAAVLWMFILAANKLISAGSGRPGSTTTTSQLPPQQKSGEPPGQISTGKTPSSNPDRSQPIRVWNNSAVRGLAEKAAADFRGDGWNVIEIGNYPLDPIPVSTAFFRTGTAEEAAAKELATRFKIRAEPRIDELADAEPGIIVIISADYSPKSR